MGQKRNEERLRLEHLRILQSVIDRLASNSFRIKRWAIAITLAILAFLSTSKEVSVSSVYWLAIGSVGLFATLDTYYLALERRVRDTFDYVRLHPEEPTDFAIIDDMSGKETVCKMAVAAKSVSVWLLYGALIVVSIFSARIID